MIDESIEVKKNMQGFEDLLEHSTKKAGILIDSLEYINSMNDKLEAKLAKVNMEITMLEE